ncbi:LysR family transcriptional regulator [Actinoplanes sp. NPDC048796]|uniref:LysR family transcriptional regulator n=1 Tax=unclassified Actinoplanes TaxID=2626549 RepID=UPI0033D564E8
MTSDLEPRLLRSFLAVAAEGHFGRASQRLRLAQPALSRQIQQLERQLGVLLFDRTPAGATLTAAGRAVVPEAERALAQNERVVRTARAAAVAGSRSITVAAPLPSPPGGLLAEAIRRLKTARPEVRVVVVDVDDDKQSAALAAGTIDAALSWGPPDSAEVRGEVLADEPSVAAVAAGHPYAERDLIPLGALAGDPLLFPVRERAHCWAKLDAAARAALVELSPVPTAPAAVPDLVADGLGVSVVPASFRLGRYPDLRFVPVPGVSGRMSVLWRRDESDPAVLDFVDGCRAAARVLTGRHPEVWRAQMSMSTRPAA